jgi:glucose-6-phosphate-specific signal transduction histidine kinase
VRNKVYKGKGPFGSFRTMLVLSVLVGIIVPLSMNFEHGIEWKKLIFIGILSFASFWAIALISLIITTLMVRGLKHKRNS